LHPSHQERFQKGSLGFVLTPLSVYSHQVEHRKTLGSSRRFFGAQLNISSQKPSELNEAHDGVQKKKTEADLIERAQGGDQRAFQALVESTQQKAFAVALGYCKNRDDAMDRVQEAYVKAYRNLTRFQGGSSFYTWFYRILMNACIDFSRREAKRKKDVGYEDGLSSGSDPLVSTTGTLENANPAKSLANKELGEQIENAMAKLSDAHREILVLREVQGLSYEELSEILGVARGTVMSRLHHARGKLKGYLESYVGQE
jgi:RNA polymerase sigma-70 factor, ECF subfamily